MPSPINLFADANVFLDFYTFTSDTLEELKKVSAAVGAGEIKLFVNDQLVDEVYRNRETVLNGAFKTCDENKVPNAYPQIIMNDASFADVSKVTHALEKMRQALFEKVRSEAATGALSADKVLDGLFENAKPAGLKQDLIGRAMLRSRRGNPPGKHSSIGDALHWEFLLDAVPKGEDLYLVTRDNDFVSGIDKTTLRPFLQREWSSAKKSVVHLFSSLGRFFKAKFPSITLAVEIERKALVDSLTFSGSFANTHAVIATLANAKDLTQNEAKQLATALTTNNQISWVASDSDVRTFYLTLVETHGKSLGDSLTAQVKQQIGVEPKPTDTIGDAES